MMFGPPDDNSRPKHGEIHAGSISDLPTTTNSAKVRGCNCGAGLPILGSLSPILTSSGTRSGHYDSARSIGMNSGTRQCLANRERLGDKKAGKKASGSDAQWHMVKSSARKGYKESTGGRAIKKCKLNRDRR